MSSWIYLILAIFFEVTGTTAMKISDGFTKVVPSIVVALAYIVSLYFLTLALKKIDVSIAYAIWSGFGTAIITLIGILYFKESLTTLKLISISLIIIGVVGLHLGSSSLK